MRDQYAGDVSDLLKYALLRALAGRDRSLGVAWYTNTAVDNRPNGRHTEYLAEQKWAALDEPLWAALRRLSERSIRAVESLPIWPAGLRFYRDPIPLRPARAAWAVRMEEALRESDLVFFDPDKGIGRASPEHATLKEVRLLRRPGRALVLIKFPAHIQHDLQEEAYHEGLRGQAGVERVVTLRTSVAVPSRGAGRLVPRLRWFTLIDGDEELARRFRLFAERLDAIQGAGASIGL